jgi:ribosomal protein S18 acetylase RimI-like enzyme
LAAWAELLAEAYGLPALLGALCAETARFGNDAPDSPMQLFAAFEYGQMLSTSQLFLHDGIAGIYCVTTHPDARGRGLGAAITAEPLKIAAKLGYRTTILQASTMGLPVYERLGFETVGGSALYLRGA